MKNVKTGLYGATEQRHGNMKRFVDQYLSDLKTVLDRMDRNRFEIIVQRILDAYHGRKTIFVMGNGGSGATASHFACDINKGCCLDLDKKFKVICLNDNIPTLLAFSNDVGYEVVFREQLKNFLSPEDLVIGISGSGNSANVINALEFARDNGGVTVGLTGFSGGRLAQVADHVLVADIHDMQKVEDVHMIAVHMIMQAVYAVLHHSAF